MGLIRKPNWAAILIEQIELAKQATFEYGKHDCTIWAANVVKSYTDLKWEATWSNEKEAMIRHKRKPMEDQVSDLLGAPIGNILLTRRGDVVQRDLGIKSSLGICIGSKTAFLYTKGICYFDLQDCSYSWRI
jgi:hypothetical protein